ncbi:unnamed protein product [Protopolystoma xenopodis]|uniref:Uncharacterized protein n=1 Tax=Protopolystoma xenopodis TaxID=117903 RepID=A0A448WN69_9PLAT|nr:unnamed protein product [Protopolystoma xenopodis]
MPSITSALQTTAAASISVTEALVTTATHSGSAATASLTADASRRRRAPQTDTLESTSHTNNHNHNDHWGQRRTGRRSSDPDASNWRTAGRSGQTVLIEFITHHMQQCRQEICSEARLAHFDQVKIIFIVCIIAIVLKVN